MARFDRAFELTLANEGGYSNDPNDPGGETVLGITRRDHPDWRGWAILAARGPNAPELRLAAGEVYKSRYWDRFDGDSIPSQLIAEELFDTAVNVGVGKAVTFLQRALNALNVGATLWPDVTADGDMGPRTREALAAALGHHDEKYLLEAMNALQASHYLELADRSPRLERYVRGWLDQRVFKSLAAKAA